MAANVLPLLQIFAVAAIIAALFLSPLPTWLALLIAGVLVLVLAVILELRNTPAPAKPTVAAQ